MNLSFSQLSTYLTCPQRYAYRYVQRLPEALSWQSGFGTSIHNALYRFTQETHGAQLWKKLEDGKGPGPQQTLFALEVPAPVLPPEARLMELLDEAWVSARYASTEEMYAAKHEAITLLRSWYATQAPLLLTTVAAEMGFRLDLGNAVLTGRFDRIDKREGLLVVVDYKSGMPRSQADVDGDLQLSLYALVLQEQLSLDKVCLELYFLRENTSRATWRNMQQTQETRQLVTTTASRIIAEDFAATPSERTCGYCPFRNICPSRFTPAS